MDLLLTLGRACFNGALLILLVWAVCRVAPGIPARIRYWLWWLCCARMVVSLLFLTPITLNLPLPEASLPGMHSLQNLLSPALAHPTGPVKHPRHATGVNHAVSRGNPLETAIQEEPEIEVTTAPGPLIAPPPLDYPSLLVFAWALGAATVLTCHLLSASGLLRSARGGRVLSEDMVAGVAEAVGLRRVPRVALSPNAGGPCVTGLLQPVIVLPSTFWQSLSPTEQRLTLAHEMAHLKRGDLWLGILPLLARALFFFFPPIWFACREAVQAREEACDALTMDALGCPPALYGCLLVKAVTAQRQPQPAAAPGMASVRFVQIKRRLLALTAPPAKASRKLGAVCLLLLGLSLVPWRLGARVEGEKDLKPLGFSPAVPHYQVSDMGTLGGKQSDAFAISSSGDFIAGAANTRSQLSRGHAFLWHQGQLNDLSSGSTYQRSIAYAVNNRGQAAAAAFNRRSRPEAFLWNGRRRYLPPLPGYGYCRALDLNDSGQVVGVAQRSVRPYGALPMRATLWDAEGNATDLGTLGGPYSLAYAISNDGRIVGKADLPRTAADGGIQTHAFLWENGAMQDLGTLPGGANSVAYDLNQAGAVVGWSESAEGKRACVWLERGPHSLPLPDGVVESVAYAINAAGVIVGAAVVAVEETVERRALLWLPDRFGYTVYDLTALARQDSSETVMETAIEAARGISDNGEIVGVGLVGGKRRAIRLSPRPPGAG